MPEESSPVPEEKRVKQSYKFYWILLGCLICISGIVGYVYWHQLHLYRQQHLPLTPVAQVQVAKLVSKHRDYAKLQTLEQELKQLQQDLMTNSNQLSGLAAVQLKPVAGLDSQMQQTAQEFGRLELEQQLRDEVLAKQQELKQALAQSRQEAIAKIDDRYENAILNDTLKLDNANNLGLSRQEYNAILAELIELKQRRNHEIALLDEGYRKEIQSELAAWQQQRRAELVATMPPTASPGNNMAMADQQNTEQQLQQLAAIREARFNLQARIQAKQEEIMVLQSAIIRDIASMATKVAIQRHINVVVNSEAGVSKQTVGNKALITAAEDITPAVEAALVQAGLLVK